MTIRFGDLDDVELIQEIERAFEIKLPDRETVECRTFGDLYDCVARRVSHSKDGACLSARAFRRLRRELGEPATSRLRPSTPISELPPGLRRELENDRGLELAAFPRVVAAPLTYLGCLGLVAAPVIGAITHSPASYGIALLAMLALVGASARWPRRVKPYLTLADVVSANAPYNLGALVSPGKPIRTADLWSSLEAITRAHAACVGPIDRRTRFEHV